MKHFVLLGAGFSRNWGGLLATEAFDFLLGCPETNKPVRQLLWKHHRQGGFEAALGELQGQSVHDDRLEMLQTAIASMFEHMDKAYQDRRQFDFPNESGYSIIRFLTKFDAILTLNQDLLLERYYSTNRRLMSENRWSDWYIPGMTLRHPPEDLLEPEPTGIWGPSGEEFVIRSHDQPVLKLHGSSNWRDDTDGQMMILGTEKTRRIGLYPILARLYDEFRALLLGGQCRLMVIGYGFEDHHINSVIQQSIRDHDSELFVVDPLGSDAFCKNNDALISAPDEFVQTLREGLIGVSRRPLSSTFSEDALEHAMLLRFFSGK